MNVDLTKKADPNLREALATASDDEILCVYLQLDTGNEPYPPKPDPSDFTKHDDYMRALGHLSAQRIYRAVKGTLEELRAFGINTDGWEAGALVLNANRATILKALSCEGVQFGVLDWDDGFHDSLVNEEANLLRYIAEGRKAQRAE